MGKWVGVAVLAVLALLGAGLFVTWVSSARVEQARIYCANNLRELAQFADPPGVPDRPADPEQRPAWAVPPGTVPNPGLPPDRRLSWVVPVFPTLDQKRQDAAALAAQLRQALPWDAGPNQSAARTTLGTLLCFGNPARVPEGEYAVTQYVGNGGVGSDTPALPWPSGKPPPTAGAFRYDAPTPADAIADGLSESVLFAEVSADLGPWLRGGPATVRTLDAGTGARPPVGAGGQFGGNHVAGANFGFADGRVQFFTSRTDPVVLYRLFTIAGDAAGIPGD